MAVNPIVRILERQRSSGFEGFRGADVSATVPISEPLFNELLRESLPESIPVRDLHVAPLSGDRLVVRARVGSASFLPPLKATVLIDRQPELPTSPILGLRLMSPLIAMAAPLLRFLDAPSGIRVEGDRILVDIAALLDRRGLGRYLEHVHALEVHTVDGAVVATIRAGVPGG